MSSAQGQICKTLAFFCALQAVLGSYGIVVLNVQPLSFFLQWIVNWS